MERLLRLITPPACKLRKNTSHGAETCHDLKLGGVDGRPSSVGVGGAIGVINAPTVFNAGLNFVQFWNGRAATLEAQANGPIQNASEMGSNWPDILAKRFDDPFSDGLTEGNVRTAIADFDRALVTPSPFDACPNGNSSAISPQSVRGLERFSDLGCIACHLRNVARTAPYFHDASAQRLPDAVRVMARYQLGRQLSEAEVTDIVTFVESLTGEHLGKPI